MTNRIEDELQRIVARMDNQESQDNPQTPQEEIKDIYVLIVREQEEVQSNVVESTSTPVIRQQDSFISAYLFVCFSLFLILSTLTFQLYSMFNPPIATITIIPKSQTLTLSGTLHLGRLLQPITISQTATTPTTGRSHQIARAATGTVTFFNGLFTQQFIASGTVYTGNDGVEIVTSQDATIPPGSPNTGYGTLTVTAQAIEAGSKGNLQAGDIDIAINNGLLVRNNQFSNGQDERNFQTVAKSDIPNVASTLKPSLERSMQGALQGQLKQSEQLSLLPCTPTIASDHQPGQEAMQVKVTVSQTCNAVAYNNQELATKATNLLSRQATTKLSGYSLFDAVTVKTVQASVTTTAHPLVFLSFQASGKWVYGLTHTAQEQIKHLIANKTTQQAVTLLASLPGVEQASIRLSGFGDDTRLPKQSSNIHLTIIVV